MIRIMTLEDIDAVMPLMERSFNKNIKPQGMTWDLNTTLATAKTLITQGITLVHENTVIDAIISGIVIPSMFDNNTILSQILIWYTEASGGVGIRLLRQFEKEAKKRNASLIMFGSPLMVSIDSHEIYMRLGYKELEIQYIKEI